MKASRTPSRSPLSKPRVAWFNCFSGISGDMCLGALIDAGATVEGLMRGLKGMPLKGYSIAHGRAVRSGIEAARIDVVVKESPPRTRKWKDIRELIGGSSLPEGVKDKGLEIFRSLFEAEGRVHGSPFQRVHLHELGAVDALVDVIGTLLCLKELGVERVFSSPINLGGGTVKAAHGLLPVPAPATAELLKGVPSYGAEGCGELATPTGAAIIKGVSEGFGPMPPMLAESIGYGAGHREMGGVPNVLRVFVGELEEPGPDDEGYGSAPAVTVIEANIDDMNPQVYGYVMERLLEEGALDVYLTQVVMKKGRPGVLLTVLCSGEMRDALSDLILRETTTIGLRHTRAERTTLRRKIRRLRTVHGVVNVKEAWLGGELLRTSPEYEDCKRIAREKGLPLLEVLNSAREGDKKPPRPKGRRRPTDNKTPAR